MTQPGFPSEAQRSRDLAARQRRGRVWQATFMCATLISIVALLSLLYNIIDHSFGLVAMKNAVEPATLSVEGIPLERQDAPQLIAHLQSRLSAGLIRRYESEKPLSMRTPDELRDLVYERIVKPQILHSWSLTESWLERAAIERDVQEKHAGARLEMRRWVSAHFLTHPQSSRPEMAGIRTAILGSLWTILITIVVAFPIGVGASIYLEEYAPNHRLTRIIQTNISNLAGVPSIIYGMLGLALFVRIMEPVTSGALFAAAGEATANGRTVLSAALTLALLVLPLLIINGQEAIKAVPRSLREASYGMGATQWQTMWHHVLPSALPGILTGTILAVSRAIGETAPLVVVGASTFVALDPSGPFSKFTTLPIQIYQWTSRPIAEFRNLAAAAILVLMVLLLTLNASAILLRNHYRSKGAA